MKTLQDYINESILDDEEVLVADTKKSVSNPFCRIQSIASNSNYLPDDTKAKQEIESIIRKELLPDFPSGYSNICRFKYMDNGVRLLAYSNIHFYEEDLIMICNNNLEAATSLKANKGDKVAILFLDAKAWRKYVKMYGFKSTPDYHNWIEYIAAKYKLNKTTDKYIYTI